MKNAEESKTLKVPLTFRPDGIFFTAENSSNLK